MEDDGPTLTPMGETMLAALVDLEKHLETHDCTICVKKMAVFLRSAEEWMKLSTRPTEKGADHGSEKETQKEGEPAEQSKGADPYDIFK